VIDAGSNVMQREMSLSRVTRQKLHVDLIERLAEVGEPTDYRTGTLLILIEARYVP